MKSIFIPLCILLAFLISCNDTTYVEKSDIKIDNDGIETFISFIDFNVTRITSNSTHRSASSDETEYIIRNIHEFEKIKGVNLHSTPNGIAIIVTPNVDDQKRLELQNKLVSYCQNSLNETEFLDKLHMLKAEILADKVSDGIKYDFLNRIALLEKFVDYLNTKVHLTSAQEQNTRKVLETKCDGWWACWGKCVAGTVGGAGLGALGGAATGGAGCTVVLPIVGTVACGTAGAVAGGIAGGLAGASQSCD